MKNIKKFLSENFHFLVGKFSVYLNRHVFVMLLRENIFCGYSLEVLLREAFTEYPQHMFSWKSKKYPHFGKNNVSYMELQSTLVI